MQAGSAGGWIHLFGEHEPAFSVKMTGQSVWRTGRHVKFTPIKSSFNSCSTSLFYPLGLPLKIPMRILLNPFIKLNLWGYRNSYGEDRGL